MSKSSLVFRIHFSQFRQEKGMIAFYMLFIVLIGMIPCFLHKGSTFFTIAVFVTAIFLKPILAESVAGEREHRTLETLLSSPIKGNIIIWGKVKFCLWFALTFFGAAVVCGTLLSWITSNPIAFRLWQWIFLILLAVLNFFAISMVGVYISSKSEDMHTAHNRISRITYSIELLFVIALSVIITADYFVAVTLFCMVTIVYLCIIIIYVFKINKMKQPDFFELLKIKKAAKEHGRIAYIHTPKSQFLIVLGFEFKYLMKLKMMLLNFGFLCFAPVLLSWAAAYFLGERMNLNYAIFTTAFMIPRVPVNLIAYSIGGEKVYKTGESLLSTPLHIRSVFLAKCVVPIVVTAVMLILSSLLTLIGVNIIGLIMPAMAPLHGYTAGQLLLVFPVSILTSMIMIFISAIFSVILKTPRHGLYVNNIISLFFLIPTGIIVYVTNNSLIWSLVYVFALIIVNVICIRMISDKITRPQIMGRL